MAEDSYRKFLDDLSRVEKKTLEDAIDEMATAREKYKTVINEYYKKKQNAGSFFPVNREDTPENFKDDLRQ